MATMGRYCKAYPLARLRAFPEWREGPEGGPLADEAIVYLQENHTVTAGVFADEGVIFDAVTPAWREFCRAALAFEVPAEIT